MVARGGGSCLEVNWNWNWGGGRRQRRRRRGREQQSDLDFGKWRGRGGGCFNGQTDLVLCSEMKSFAVWKERKITKRHRHHCRRGRKKSNDFWLKMIAFSACNRRRRMRGREKTATSVYTLKSDFRQPNIGRGRSTFCMRSDDSISHTRIWHPPFSLLLLSSPEGMCGGIYLCVCNIGRSSLCRWSFDV